MPWLSFRQFRVQSILAAAGLAGLGVLVVIVGVQLWDYFDHSVTTCARGRAARAQRPIWPTSTR